MLQNVDLNVFRNGYYKNTISKTKKSDNWDAAVIRRSKRPI